MLLDQPSPDPRTPVSPQTGRRPNTVAHGFTALTYLRDRKISQDMSLCKYMSIFYIHLHLCVSVYLYEYLCPYVYYVNKLTLVRGTVIVRCSSAIMSTNAIGIQ